MPILSLLENPRRINPRVSISRGVSGFLCALAGWAAIGRVGSASPQSFAEGNLDAITAVVIGGTSLMGGTGGAVGTVFGALLLAVLSNLMNLIGISPFDQQIVKGVVIVLAVLLAMQATRKRISDRRAKLGRSASAGDPPSQ